jgi:hypothetical protein
MSSLSIERFNGVAEAFPTWKFRVEMTLRGFNALTIVEGKERKPNGGDPLKDWMKREGKAYRLLCNALGDKMLPAASQHENSADLWNYLKNQYENRGR